MNAQKKIKIIFLFLFLSGCGGGSESSDATKPTAEPTTTTATPTKTTAEPTTTTAEPTKKTAEPTKTTAKPAKTTTEPTKTTVELTTVDDKNPVILSLENKNISKELLSILDTSSGIKKPYSTDKVANIKTLMIELASASGGLKGIEYFTSLEDLSVRGKSDLSYSISGDDLGKGLNNLTKLSITDVAFVNNQNLRLEGMSNLKELDIYYQYTYDVNRNLRKLVRDIYLSKDAPLVKIGLVNAKLANIAAPLTLKNKQNLTSIFIMYNTKLKELNLTDAENIIKLHTYRTQIETLTIKDASKLKTIHLDNGALENVELENLPEMTYALLSNNKINRLVIKKSEKLNHLNIENNNLSNLTGVDAPSLQYLNISQNPVSSVSDNIKLMNNLSELHAIGNNDNNVKLTNTSLKKLRLGGPLHDSKSDVNPLSPAHIDISTLNLSELYIDNQSDWADITIKSLKMPPLQTSKLEVLFIGVFIDKAISTSFLKDLELLPDLKKLTYAPLAKEVTFENLTQLQELCVISGNVIKLNNIPKLTALRFETLPNKIILDGTEITDFSKLKERSITYSNYGCSL